MTRKRLVELILFGGAAACPVVVALPLTDQFALPKLALALIITSLLLMLTGPRFLARRWSAQPVPVAAALLLLAVLAIATATADYPRASVLGTYADYSGLVYYVPGVVAFCVAAATIRGIGAMDRLVSLLAIGALPVLGYALVQFAGADPVSWDIGFGRRVFSTLGQPLVLGGYLAMLLPLLLWLALRRRGGERIFLAAETVLAGAMLIATGTRGAYLGAIAGAIVAVALLFVMRGVTRRRLLLAAAGPLAITVLVAGLWTAGAVPERMQSAATLSERTHLWRGGIEMAKDRPLLGWGPDQFAVAYGPYRPSSGRGTQSPYEAPAASPHNETLTMLLAGGVMALAAYGLLWGSVAVAASRAPRKGRRPHAVVALAAALVAYLTQAQLSITDTSLNLIAMTLLGALAGLSPPLLRWPFALPRVGLIAGPMRIAGAGLFVVALALVAADYAATRGIRATNRGDSAANGLVEFAVSLNPVQAAYLDDLAFAHETSIRWGVAPDQARASALAAYERRIARFGASAPTYLDAARLSSASRDSREAMERYLDQAARADPKNPGLQAEIDEIRRNAVR